MEPFPQRSFAVGIADYSPVTSVTADTHPVRENNVETEPGACPSCNPPEAVMKFPKWSLFSFLVVVFFPINLCVALAGIQAQSTSLGATQELPSEYQSGKIVAVQTTEWQTEYVVQISVQRIRDRREIHGTVLANCENSEDHRHDSQRHKATSARADSLIDDLCDQFFSVSRLQKTSFLSQTSDRPPDLQEHTHHAQG
jgi:hypothetical protein